MDKNLIEYYKKIVGPINGGTITGLIQSQDSWGLAIKKGEKVFKVWVDMDPEGNGPGHLDVEEDKE